MIIGVTGPAGGGKDTASEYIQRYNFAQIAFADPVKRIAMEVYDFSKEQLWGPSDNRNAPDHRYSRAHGPWVDGKCVCCGYMPVGKLVGPVQSPVAWPPPCFLTPRYALQTLGTEWGRHCYGDTWAAKGMRVADKLQRGGYSYSQVHGLEYSPSSIFKGVVISDLRFKNEMGHVRAYKGLLLRVKRGVPATNYNGHASEAEQLDVPDSEFDAVIHNDGTLPELFVKLAHFMGVHGCPM